MEPTAKSKCKPVMMTPMKSTECQTTDNSNLTQDGSLFYWKEHKTILISYWCFLVPQKVFYHLDFFYQRGVFSEESLSSEELEVLDERYVDGVGHRHKNPTFEEKTEAEEFQGNPRFSVHFVFSTVLFHFIW